MEIWMRGYWVGIKHASGCATTTPSLECWCTICPFLPQEPFSSVVQWLSCMHAEPVPLC